MASSEKRTPLELNMVGRLTRRFLRSKIVAPIMLAAGLFGLVAVLFTPRNYNPEISVPAATVIVRFAGASPAEVHNQVVRPLEALMAAIKGVDHTYGYATNDLGIVSVRFKVGEETERSLVKVYNQIARNLDRIPPGVSRPLVRSTTIDDVPILTVTLSSSTLGPAALRGVGMRVLESLRNVQDVGDTRLYGANPEAVIVRLDPARLAATGLTLDQVEGELRQANVVLPAGDLVAGNRSTAVRVSAALGTPSEVGDVLIGAPNGKPVFLKDIARIELAPREPERYALFGLGPADGADAARRGTDPAVVLAIDKRAGANNVTVAHAVLGKLHELERQAIPAAVRVSVTRDYGQKANAAVNTLIEHLGIAVASVGVILLLFLGWREAAIVMLTVPLVLAVVLGVDFVIGQTINRITLFALILALGLLVDDAIVVIENIHRHLHLPGHERFFERLVLATNEIGRPTNIATVAVILAFIPMAFVTGMMGPFMRPIPINAPVAMLVSLMTAYVVVPWIALRWLRGKAASVMAAARRPTEEERGAAPRDPFRRLYFWGMRPLLGARSARLLFLGLVLLLLALAMLQPLWQYIRPGGENGPLSAGGVAVKMLPDDNTNTMLVEVETPAGTALERTAQVVARVTALLRETPYVTDFVAYLGMGAPPDFAALVRGDTMREGSNLAQVRVNLTDKDARSVGSHAIAQHLYAALAPLREAFPATRVKIFETPPGPPVRAQVLAELYGPSYPALRRIAGYVEHDFRRIYGISDVDDSVTADAPEERLVVDAHKAMLAGLAPAAVARVVHDYMAGFVIGMLRDPAAREPVNIIVRLPRWRRGLIEQLLDLRLRSQSGQDVPLGSVVHVEPALLAKPIYTQDQHPVVYVAGNMLRSSPVTAVVTLQKELNGKALPNHVRLRADNLGFISKRPDDVSRYVLFWGGEMRLTLDVFRDLGSAFIVALLLIYLLLTGYYQSFAMPLVVMGAIPLTLVGVFPGHWLLHQPFTATSMIGVIALAGIVVRNSLLLIDFILDYRARGADLRAAILEAGAVRFRPILLTALAIMSASFIMVTDPVFGGLAISLIFGTLASTVLTLFVIPLLYFLWQARAERSR